MLADHHQYSWTHHRQSIREDDNNNNIVKTLQYFSKRNPFQVPCSSTSLHSSSSSLPLRKTNLDNTEFPVTSNFHFETGNNQMFNLTNSILPCDRDQETFFQTIQKLTKNFNAENAFSHRQNTFLRNISTNSSREIREHLKPKEVNEFSIREILRPRKEAILGFGKPDLRNNSQILTGFNTSKLSGEHKPPVMDSKEKEQIIINNKNGINHKKMIHEEPKTIVSNGRNNISQSAFSIPNHATVPTETSGINKVHTHPSLTTDFLSRTKHIDSQGDSSSTDNKQCTSGNKLCTSGPRSQPFPYESFRQQQSPSSLSPHLDELISNPSSPPLTPLSHCHRDRMKFQCPQCRYVTDRKNNLMRHIITMHQDSGKVLECCGMSFQSKASLREHNAVFHSGGYRCQICSRNFCRKALLRRHLTVHSGQKDFFCDLCGYATSHKSNLERHQKVHNKRQNSRMNLLNSFSTAAYKSNIINNNSRCIITNTHSSSPPGHEVFDNTSHDVNQFSPNSDCDSDIDIIEVDSCSEEFYSLSPMSYSDKDRSVDDIVPAIPKLDAKNSTILPPHRPSNSRPKRAKRKGFFTSRLQATHINNNDIVKSTPFLYNVTYLHQINNVRSEIDHGTTHIPDLNEESDYEKKNDVAIGNIVTVTANTEKYIPTLDTLNVEVIKHDDDNDDDGEIIDKDCNDQIMLNMEGHTNSNYEDPHSNPISLLVEDNNKQENTSMKFKICPILYPCSDCHRKFPNQIMYHSHQCHGIGDSRLTSYAIPIVMAVQKGRVQINDGC